MSVREWRRGLGVAVMVCCVARMSGTARALSPDDLDALNQQVNQLYQAGKYTEAITVAERSVDVARKRYGEEDTRYGTAISNLAVLLEATDRTAEAEPLFRRALAIDEKSLGPEHPDVARNLNNLAGLLQATNRLAEAEPLMWRALAIDEKALGQEHAITVLPAVISLKSLREAAKASQAEEPFIGFGRPPCAERGGYGGKKGNPLSSKPTLQSGALDAGVIGPPRPSQLAVVASA